MQFLSKSSPCFSLKTNLVNVTTRPSLSTLPYPAIPRLTLPLPPAPPPFLLSSRYPISISHLPRFPPLFAPAGLNTPYYAWIRPHGHQHPVRETKWRASTRLRSILCLRRPKSDSTLALWPHPQRNTGTHTVKQYVHPRIFSLELTPVFHR